jgi:hypothetical protein
MLCVNLFAESPGFVNDSITIQTVLQTITIPIQAGAVFSLFALPTSSSDRVVPRGP